MDLQSLTKQDIHRELKPGNLRATSIIQAAFMAGPLLFLLVVLFLNYSLLVGQPARERGPDLESLMLMTLGVLALGCWTAAVVLPAQMLKPQRLKPLATANNPVDWMLGHHRTISIVRLTLTEGPALFGLVILIMAALARNLDQHPFIWLSTVPLWVHLIAGLLTFPAKNSVVEFMDQRILKPFQRSSNSL